MGKKYQTIQKTIETGVFKRTYGIDLRKLDEEKRVVNLSFSSEDPYERFFGIEILDHSPESVKMDFIASGRAPLLKNHWQNDQIGVVESASIGKDRKGRASVRFGKSDLAEQEFVDVKDGIRQNVSVGYRVNKMVLEEQSDDGPDVYRVTDWEPLEISIVGIPADKTVGVGRSEEKRVFETIIETRELKPETEVKIMEKTAEELAADVQAKKDAEAKEQANLDRIRKGAADEVREILTLGAVHGFKEEANQALKDGTSVDSFRQWVLNELSKKHEPAETPDIGLKPKEIQRYSFFKALRATIQGPNQAKYMEAAKFEMECSKAAAIKLGVEPRGLIVPNDVLITNTRTLVAGTSTDGEELVQTDLLAGSFIDVLRNLMVVMAAGARLLPGLVGNVAIPRKTSGAAGAWITAENNPAAPSEAQFDQVTLTPKTVAAYTDMSRQLMLQSTPAIEGLIRDDLAVAMAIAIDYGALYGSGTAGAPTGISNTTGINTPSAFAAAVPTWAEVVALESAVAVDNALMGSLAYIIEPAMRGSLKTKDKGASPTAQFIMSEQGNQLNGYNAFVTSQVTSGDIFFGNWADLLIGLWGGLDILADPYTNSTTGALRLVAFQSVDVGVRHPVSFAMNNDT